MKNHPTSTLTIHPLIASLPRAGGESAAAIAASVADIGVIEPLKVSKGRVIDGRDRLDAALAAGLAEVPITEIPEDAIAGIFIASLCARHHFTKSAVAYLAFPVLDAALQESRRRAVSAARSFLSGAKSESAHRTPPQSADALAAEHGIARTTFFEAAAIHKKFAEHPKLRATWEPKILSGEMGLGQIQQALSGKIASLEGRTTPKGDAGQLLLDLFAIGPVRFERWGKLDATQRTAAATSFREKFLPSLPAELLREVEDYLRAHRTGIKAA